MILEQLGMLCDGTTIVTASGYFGYAIDLASALADLGSIPIWIDLRTNVVPTGTTPALTFKINCGTGTDGTNLNAGVITAVQTPSIALADARVAAIGARILNCTLPIQANLRYLQLYVSLDGNADNTMKVDFNLSPYAPRTDYHIQVDESPVGVP